MNSPAAGPTTNFPFPNAPARPLFLLTIDTEEEWDWNGDFPRPPFSTRNIEQLPAFQQFCDDLGAPPSYFVDQAVIDDEMSVGILREILDSGRADFGAHLHPWCTPPINEEICEHNSHAVNLPIELFRKKINTLTARLTETFGRHPYSYRAGRWGVNGSHLRALADAGYRVDSSVRPFYADTSFSYDQAPTRPYFPSFEDVIQPDVDQQSLLEIPVTSGYNRAAFETLHKLHTKLSTPPLNQLRLIGMLWHLGLIRKTTVTPEGHDSADICQCIDASIARGDRVINLFFHSSDLLPGCTPYVQSSDEKRRFLDCLKRCIEHMRHKHNATFITMREIRTHMLGDG